MPKIKGQKMRTIAFHNLGCKVNSYETDAMAQKCVEKGYKIVDFEQKADIYVVNTCSVTNIADRKSRQMLHKAKKQNPDSVVVAVGCFVQANPEEVAKDEAIDLIVGNNKKKDLFEIIEEYLNNKSVSTETVTDVHHCDYEELKINKSEEHSRVFVKIQDGCDRYCTYCIIPYVRGNLRSRNPEDVVEEIKEIATNGYREVVITGIHLSSYGKDFLKDGKPSLDYSGNADYLINLLKDINEIEGIDRIRIGSFEPMILSEVFVSKLSKITKLCPHFHISLQSGSDAVLKRMNRHYTSGEFAAVASEIRRLFPDAALTTDVICGFPCETEDEFLKTLDFVGKMRFEKTHIFPYSKREGTPAAKMDGQLTAAVKSERCRRLKEVCDKTRAEYVDSRIGMTYEVLFETPKGGMQTGYTKNYIPVTAAYSRDLTGERRLVRIEAFDGERARASVLSDF